MSLNKQKGNMYPWVTHTWNPIRGKCPHDCSYCYMKGFPQPELHFAEKELETNLGEGNFIFVGSSTDMWANEVHTSWISDTLKHCQQFRNRYLFQSKNPIRFCLFRSRLPNGTVLGTTLESNRYSTFSKAPPPLLRKEAMRVLALPKMVSIEPVMDFDLDDMVRWMVEIKPEFVSIGADSKGHNLPEPSPEKLQKLIEHLQAITTVELKDNLNRILRQELPEPCVSPNNKVDK